MGESELVKHFVRQLCDVDRNNKNEEFLNRRGTKIDPIVQRSIKKRVDDVWNGVTQPHISYGEGNQSQVTGKDGLVLCQEWISLMDYLPSSGHMSDWCTAVFCGDYYYVLNRVMEDRELLFVRESLLNVSAVFHVVMGAKILLSDVQDPQLKLIQNGCRDLEYANMSDKDTRDHLKVLEMLISLGVDVNAKDFAGCTPLHYCCSHEGKKVNDVVYKMAETLIQAGANVNAKSRTGHTPLHHCVIECKMKLIHLLLDNGADIYIEGNNGQSPLSMVADVPFLSELFIGREKKPIEEERRRLKRAAGGNFRKCAVCDGVHENGNKRCSGCYLIWYCSRDCQVGHWDQHREECKVTQAEYKTFYVLDDLNYGTNHIDGKPFCRLPGERPKKSHFVCKVQIWREPKDPKVEGLRFSDEDGLLHCHVILESCPDSCKELFDKIKKEGAYGRKGYFYALIPKDGVTERDGWKKVIEIKVNTARILPVEMW